MNPTLQNKFNYAIDALFEAMNCLIKHVTDRATARVLDHMQGMHSDILNRKFLNNNIRIYINLTYRWSIWQRKLSR